MGWSDLGSKTKRNTIFCVLYFIIPLSIYGGLISMRKGGKRRPDFNAIGCAPYKQRGCPARTECLIDYEMAPTYGRCTCIVSESFHPEPPTFDDEEVDILWSERIENGTICKVNYKTSITIIAFMIPPIFSIYMFGKVTVATLWSLLKQNEKFKWNSTTRGLVFIMVNLYYLPLAFGYILRYLGMDRFETYHDFVIKLCVNMIEYFYCLGSYELITSWFDLVQRTVKLSRSSSGVMIFFRWFFRLINVLYALYIQFGKWGTANRMRTLTIVMSIHMVLNFIPGAILIRMLCKDRKDVSNPNWKAAEVIRRTITVNLQLQCLAIVAFQGLKTSVYPDYWQYNVFELPAYLWCWWFNILSAWVWLHYVLFGCRKLLAGSDSEKVSQYYGFTTIGLNSTLASGISRVSSVASSFASVASTASIAEVDKDQDGEKEEKEEAVKAELN